MAARRARIALFCLAATAALALALTLRPAAAPASGPAAAAAATPAYPIPTPSPSPTPTPTPTPSSSLSLLIMAVRSPALHGRTLAWSVRCLPHACRAALTVRVKIGGEKHARRLATVHCRVPSTRDRRVAVRVRGATIRAVRRAWRRHRRVFADVRGVAVDGRNTASFRLHTRLRPPRAATG